MNRNRCVEAVFGTMVSSAVSGAGSVTLDPQATGYPYGSSIRLSAVPQAGSGFAIWGNAASGTNSPLIFSVTNANPVISAAFGVLNAGQVTLSVVPSGRGRVDISPRANRYFTGAVVTLTALPEPGQAFIGWRDDASGSANPLTVTMNGSKSITADFTKRPLLKVFVCETPNADKFSLQITGEPGGVYSVEGSSNLQQWVPMATVTNRFGTVQFDNSSGGAHRFYRLTPP
jgi:hypothetical protein